MPSKVTTSQHLFVVFHFLSTLGSNSDTPIDHLGQPLSTELFHIKNTGDELNCSCSTWKEMVCRCLQSIMPGDSALGFPDVQDGDCGSWGHLGHPSRALENDRFSHIFPHSHCCLWMNKAISCVPARKEFYPRHVAQMESSIHQQSAGTSGMKRIRLMTLLEQHSASDEVYYSLQLSNGRECWMVQRRYSEFLRWERRFHRHRPGPAAVLSELGQKWERPGKCGLVLILLEDHVPRTKQVVNSTSMIISGVVYSLGGFWSKSQQW